MLQVVVEQAANGGHVDVRKAREATGEIGRVVVCAEQAAELTVEHVLCLRPATSRAHSYSHGENNVHKTGNNLQVQHSKVYLLAFNK